MITKRKDQNLNLLQRVSTTTAAELMLFNPLCDKNYNYVQEITGIILQKLRSFRRSSEYLVTYDSYTYDSILFIL